MLTPHDIESKMFKMSFRGYNTAEVDDFLQEICDSYAEIYMENKKYKEQNARLSEAVGQYKSMEDTLQDALNVADISTGEITKNAEGKAELTIKNAEKIAADIIAGAKQKTNAEKQRFNEFQQRVEIYRSKIEDLLKAQMNILDSYPVSVAEKTDEHENEDTEEKMRTENLPTIKMNEKGEYVTAK